MEEIRKNGGISVDTEHIFPIIKKWLYSEKDIFLREIVSNATDAVTKLRRLESLGVRDGGDEAYKITVTVDSEAKTLCVEDNGIGMTEEELTKYICNIALSGAVEFIQKYESESDGSKNGIIGHFGLGFYSAFMVSDTVEVITRSYTGAPAVHWICGEDGAYEMSTADVEAHGTKVIMHITEEESGYLSISKIRAMLEKYCAFMPEDIYLVDANAEKKDDAAEPINDKTPLWQKQPSECEKEEYNEFYHKVFGDFRDPQFYIHINADYPLNFKGILYFPKFANEYESIEGQIKLYYNQVYVADNIKEVIPEYLLMLKGVLDCPELPLNVSRSYLQDNAYVKKIGQHIVKKVADKLNSLMNNDREKYEKVYDDIRVFIEYACLRERKFYDRVKDSLLLRLVGDNNTTAKSVTIDEYLAEATGKHEGKIYYTNDIGQQAQTISLFREEGVEVAVFDLVMDSQYLAALEHYRSDIKFIRVDAGVTDIIKEEFPSEVPELTDNVIEMFKKVSSEDNLTVNIEALKNEEVPAILSVSEESRRMQDMMKLYALGGDNVGAFTLEYTLTLNNSSSLCQKLISMINDNLPQCELFASYIYKLALISHRKLSADELNDFLANCYKILELI